MGRRVGVILSEMLDAIDGIETATGDMSVRQFSDDWLVKHAVQRGIEIISEAARHLPDDMLATAPEIPWNKVRGMGNILRHEYHKIADPIVWAVVIQDLPPLRAAIERLLAEMGPEGVA